MYPGIWGTAVWDTIHIFALNYPRNPTDRQEQNMLELIKLLCLHLPCPNCRYHALIYVNQNPPTTGSREELETYFYDFHNEVNERLGKDRVTYADARRGLFDRRVRPLLLAQKNNMQSGGTSDKQLSLTGPAILFVVFAVVLFGTLLCYSMYNVARSNTENVRSL